MSAVSKKLMPASSAACTTSADRCSSIVMPKLLQPSPTTETFNEPMRRVFIRRCSAGLQACQGRGLPHEIGDVAADGLSESRCDGLAGDRCGDGVLKIVPCGRGPLDADGRVAIVDATTVDETSAAVVDGRFGSDRRTRSFDGIVV